MKRNLKINYTLEKCDKTIFKNYLKKHKTTKRAFAKKLGITVSMLDYILNGKRTLSEQLLRKFEQEGVFFTEHFNNEGVIQ